MRKIGIVGYGQYGKLLYKLLRRFSFAEVIVHDPFCTEEGPTYVPLSDLAYCDAIILAVPMPLFERVVVEILKISDLRKDTVLVNVCSEQAKSGAILAALAGSRPYLCVHSPWGPQAYAACNELVAELPALVLTRSTLTARTEETIIAQMMAVGLKIIRLNADEHDRLLAGRWMFICHLFSQTLAKMGMLEEDMSFAPPSFQLMVRGARMVKDDKKLFLALWSRVPECHITFEALLRIVHELSREMDEHRNGG